MSILVNHVDYVYNPGTVFEKKALSDVTFKIEDGEYIGLAGHTGSGKSTLVTHLNGLMKPTSGGIYIDGVDISSEGYDMKQLFCRRHFRNECIHFRIFRFLPCAAITV